MKIKRLLLSLALAFGSLPAWAQPEFYADPFIGYPEFRVLPLRLPTPDPDSVRVSVSVRVLYDDLQFIRTGERYEAGYSLDVMLQDSEDRSVGINHIERKVWAESYSQTNSRQLSDQTTSDFPLRLSNVQLRVSLMDRESRKERTVTKKIEFPSKEWGQNLRLSDLYLTDSAGSVQLSSGFLRDQPLRAAFCLYGDSPADIAADYQLLDDKERIVSSGKVNIIPDLPYQAVGLDLPLENLANGSYLLAIKVSSGATQQARSYPFRILWRDLPEFIQDLDLAIRQLKYIATDEEMDRLLMAPSSRREQIFQEFWKKQDPTPSTPTNERMEEYYRRVRYANENFSGLRDGWETDMGRVYAIFGSPTDIERHPFDVDKKPYEFWYYYDLNRKFLFVDEDGFGEYRLKTPIWHGY